MKKKSKSVPKIDPYIDGLMAKLLERLVSIERKVDALGHSSKSAPAAPAPAPRHERQMYEAVCADCSKVCEVPFKPTEERPVYCKECWGRRKSGRASNRPGMPVLTPVSLPPKPVSKLHVVRQAPPPAKTKKSKPVKKAKKKK